MPCDSNGAMTCSPSVSAELDAHVPLSLCEASCGSASRAVCSQTTLPVLPVERQQREAVHTANGQAAARRVRIAGVLRHRHGGQHVDAIAPDNRRRRAATGNLDLPADVLRFAPVGRRRGGSRDAAHLWPAPLRPELLGALLRHERHGPNGEQARARATPQRSGRSVEVIRRKAFRLPDLIRRVRRFTVRFSPGCVDGALRQSP